MLKLSKKADYGLMAVHYIAFHQHDGVVSAKRIAEDLMIPAELLAKILQRLAKGGYDRQRERAQGGLRPRAGARADPRERGPAGDRGAPRLVNCYRTMKCPQLERCNIRRPVWAIQSSIERFLKR